MNKKILAPALPPELRIALIFLSGITLLNYIAQIPYYIHFYGIYHRIPNLSGVAVFLVATLVLFLAGYLLTLQAKKTGGWLLLTFLVLEFVGYLVHNLSGAFLKDLSLHDPLFFSVSLIGYLNLVTAFIFIIVIIKYRHLLLFAQRQTLNEKGAIVGTPPGTRD